ncbi:hypothetical protein AJ80_03972 [Polytolypa hystricis UAMH7299]|uniref:EKC/KEOPS complex subunit BUD32 n=1 Tax=Polytolypa hystricis (strain UAMH7299) TaxID=1447883 RepID=A0A2B7YEM7_POLH7|nr:hypothetical protein AJ80_03972 [Polytolypa hystricis UAMH7299]
MCLVSQVLGSSATQLSYYPGRVAGYLKLRGDIARQLSRQIAEAVGFLHTSGVVYGDLTASNVLLRLTNIDAWSDKEIYERLGSPIKKNVLDSAGDTAGRHAPDYLVKPANLSHLDPIFLTKDIVLIDFGQSFRAGLPPDHGTGTPPSYCSPETFFGGSMSVASDVWALACTIHETRAGAQLFASFFGGNNEIIRQIVQTFGKLPEPWWSAWGSRSIYFGDDGKPNETWPDGIALAVEYPLEA